MTITLSSLEFAGDETSYLLVPYDETLDIGASTDFTIEWYQYQTDENSAPRIFQRGLYFGEEGVDIDFGVSIEGGQFYIWLKSNANLITTLTDYKNKWIHFAISRNSGTIRVFMDGVQLTDGEEIPTPITIEDDSAIDSSYALVIGNETETSLEAAFGGYLYGFTWISGVGKYTENFDLPPVVSLDENTRLYLTGGQTEGTLASTLVNNSVSTSPLIPPSVGPEEPVVPDAPDYRMIPFIQAQRRPVLSNNLIFYKPGSLASCGVGGTTNSRVKSRRT